MSTGSRKLWGGRFEAATDAAVERFTASVHFDRALARYDLRLSRAHARMLGACKLIGAEDQAALLEGLEHIEQEIEDGSFPFDPALEDVHMNIEARLAEKIGEPARRLHTGRSRNDQVATDLLLYLRDAVQAAERGLHELRRTLVTRAREHLDTVLPGYTHLQRAQPVRLAHHWHAYVEMLGRDAARFRDLRGRLQLSPLGSGALAGTTLPLDREATARELGFAGPARNSLDAVASRDAALEFLAATAIAMVHLSRLAEELVLWSSAEFSFVELDDAFATGSSLMPQKKNPDVPELVRAKSGRAIGNLVTLLTVLKGLPLAYNRDLQEDKEPVFDSAATLRDALEVTAGAIATLRVDSTRMRDAASDPMLLATDLAEILVGEDVPFREAHETVGRIVRHCLEKNLNLRQLTRKDLAAFDPRFPAGASELLDLDRSLEARALPGATARETVAAALDASEVEITEALDTLQTETAT
ncbi:MAG: argininosuccinate lyase [Myxococcota bacterium]|jgi:argininosuccinate lyase|nr:argininosuccinate lyase [Deltaproteobacteria bacterium]MCP4244058.1 argininosuccinate lyase [bacterium]MDP6076319.1 argininosuccinate lyase [Myxococcota bacterium]MDP6243662.1 argininosuccinate lyase [Myxococcota bacterium]MDP7074835.1 argininosuccinate lyase [Myxococcota bacterium]